MNERQSDLVSKSLADIAKIIFGGAALKPLISGESMILLPIWLMIVAYLFGLSYLVLEDSDE